MKEQRSKKGTGHRALGTGQRASGTGHWAASNGHKAFPIVLSSPSGAGKTSIARGVVKLDRDVVYSVSATTRPMRPGERNHRDYHFLNQADFLRRKQRGWFVETAPVYGWYYGTPKPWILKQLRQGCDVIMDLDIQGARSMRKLVPDSVSIFIAPPDYAELKRRLKNRRTDSQTEIRKRLACFEAEHRAKPEFDYCVVNHNLEQAIQDVRMIIRAERLKVSRRKA